VDGKNCIMGSFIIFFLFPLIIRIIKSRGMRWGTFSWHGRNENSYKILVRTLVGKRLLGRHGHKWENSIKMEVKEIGCESVDWIQLAEERFQ
jgi:hypothetical protein